MGRVEKASVLKRITDGGLGAEPPAAGGYGGLGQSPKPLGNFCKFLEKKAILIPLDHISHVFKAI